MPYKDKEAKLANAARYRAKHPEKVKEAVRKSVEKRKKTIDWSAYLKDRNLKSKYGITALELNQMIETQENLCALCQGPFDNSQEKSPVIDHDHSTGIIRGVLHWSCNIGIGHLGDNLSGVEKALGYFQSVSTGSIAEEQVEEHY